MRLSNFKKIIFETSTKNDGNMSFVHGDEQEVIENRTRFLSKYGLATEQCAVISVEHADKVVYVDEKRTGASPRETIEAEALVTDKKNVVLFLVTADCFPVAFFEPGRRAIALAHLGWRPTDLGLVQKVVTFLHSELGCNPSDLLVEFGPGIQATSYKIPKKTAMQLKDKVQHERWQEFVQDTPDGCISVDLVGFNTAQLVEAGVSTTNIMHSSEDTYRSDRYFSHYREVRTGEKTGRFATILVVT